MHSEQSLPAILGLLPLLLLGLLAGCTSVSTGQSFDHGFPFRSIHSVGVIGVEGVADAEGEITSVQDGIAVLFSRALAARGYHVVSHSRIRDLMRKEGISSVQADTVPGAEKLARILDLDAIFMLRVPHYGESVEMKATMLDVASARKVWHGWGSADEGAGREHPPAFLAGNGPELKALSAARRGQIARLAAELVADLPKGS